MSLAEERFDRAAFAALFRSESLRCLRVAVENRWLRPVPESLVYYWPLDGRSSVLSPDESEALVPAESLLSEEEALQHLFREEDGCFRSEIVLSPFAVTEIATMIEVSLRDPTWTNTVLTGKLAFPREPFQLRGPRLPPDWREGEPIPTVALPKLRTKDEAP